MQKLIHMIVAFLREIERSMDFTSPSLGHLLDPKTKAWPKMLLVKKLKWQLWPTWMRLRYPRAPKDVWGRPYPLQHALECVGKGWADLVTACYAIVVRHGGSIHQVKEKFGGLRFYVGGVPYTADQTIFFIAHTSYRICEICGEEGKTRQGGWIKTLCDEHAEGRAPLEEL